MKKIFTMVVLIALVSSFSIRADEIIVESAATLKTAFNGAMDEDTILLMPGTYNVGRDLDFPQTGAIVVKSYYDDKDSMAIIQMEIETDNVPDGTFPTYPSLIFENLHLQGRYGDYNAGGSYLFSLKQKYINIDTLAFRNCEISEVSRCVFRGERPKDTDENGDLIYTSSGNIEWLEMTNCLVHKMNSDGNEWPVFYLAHVPQYIYVRNNTFYDMPHTKSIIQLNHQETESGSAAEIYFENNTLAITFERTDGVIATSNFLHEESIFEINNNMFILPNYFNENLIHPDSSDYAHPPIIVCKGGLITANNNVIEGYLDWRAGETVDDEGFGGFLALDTTDTYTMEDLSFSWDKFANPMGGDFSYLSTEAMATSGLDGAPIGDPRWVQMLNTPRTLTVEANIEEAVVDPSRAVYEDGDEVTVSASEVDGYVFSSWKSGETVMSTENPYKFTITSDLDLVAVYTALVERELNIVIAGSESATYTVSPEKDQYYEGDEVTVEVNGHYVNTFKGWDNGSMELSRTATISGGDLTLTATFVEQPYYLVWDFSNLTRNNETFADYPANCAADPANPGEMNCIEVGMKTTLSTRNNKFDGKELHNAVARRTHEDDFSNPDYIYIKFSTEGLSNLKVKCAYATDNSIFEYQKMEYSTDSTTWTEFARDTVVGEFNQIWNDFEGTLPAAAENQAAVYVRWIADTNSTRLFAEGSEDSNTEYFYLSQIVVIDNLYTAISHTLADVESNKIYTYQDVLVVEAAKAASAEVYSITGQKVMDTNVAPGINKISGLRTGIYIVRIGNQTQKVSIY